jgi:hypothetical protein
MCILMYNVCRAQVGLNFDDVRMAVLVQRVVPAQYAFVIHTKNPSNNDETEVFCEMVRGLGEAPGLGWGGGATGRGGGGVEGGGHRRQLLVFRCSTPRQPGKAQTPLSPSPSLPSPPPLPQASRL